MSVLSGLDPSKLNVKQGTTVTPFSTVVVTEATIPIQETVQVRLAQSYSGGYAYYGGNGTLGTISDPTKAGSFDPNTNTFTEVVTATSTATAAQAVLDRLVYTPPTLADGSNLAVAAEIAVNNSDGAASAQTPVFLIPNAYTRILNDVTPPAISGTVANQPVASGAAVKPFSTVAIADQNANSTNGSTAISATILISDGGQPTDADGLLTGSGLSKTGVGAYSLSATSYYSLQSSLQQLTYTTTDKLVGNVTPSFALAVTDTQDGLATTDSTTSVGIVGGPNPVLPTPPITAATVGDAVFRFYDPDTEGHFFTSNPAEVQQIQAGKSGLVLEGATFHAVDPATDPHAVSVYRFYEASNNSHFYTDSAKERDGIVATNPAMTLEGPAFSVDQTMQAGDVTVYRYYEPRSDTHLYTTDTAEMSTIAATRPDLILEGPAFYAKS